MDFQNFNPQVGADVIGSDGEKIGEVDVVEQDYFIVRKGFFFPSDHYIPFSAVSSFEEGAIYLNVTKDGALDQQWNEAPVAGGTAGYDDGVTDTFGTTDVNGVDNANARIDDPTYGETAMGDETYTDVDRDVSDETDTIEVREEQLGATTHEVDRGALRVNKHVVEEQQSIDVPVTEEEVHVNRRTVDRPAGAGDLEESTFEVPLKGEEVEVTKETRVVEEIDIDKTARERTETVSDTVRHEEVDIDGDSDIEMDRRTTNEDRGLLDKAKDAMDPNDNTR